MSKKWSSPISSDQAARRAGGRRRYNKQRQIEAIERQEKALNLAYHTQLSNAEIAAALGVSRTTLWRYFKVAKWREMGRGRILHVKRAHGFRFEYPPGRWTAYGYWY